MDSHGSCGKTYYTKMLSLLEAYFAVSGWKHFFLDGGCYWFASTLQKGIRDSVIMINRIEEHCALAFEDGLYDITGRISVKNFHRASMREISFMKKNYIPHFNTEELEEYLAGITE